MEIKRTMYKRVILSEALAKSKNLRIYSLQGRSYGAKILRLAVLAQDDRKRYCHRIIHYGNS